MVLGVYNHKLVVGKYLPFPFGDPGYFNVIWDEARKAIFDCVDKQKESK